MEGIDIYFKDLTPEKQKEIIDTFGDNCNYDVIPIVTIPVNNDDDESVSD